MLWDKLSLKLNPDKQREFTVWLCGSNCGMFRGTVFFTSSGACICYFLKGLAAL